MLGHFFLTQALPADVIIGVYDPIIVMLSFVLAAIASYVSLDLVLQMRQEKSRKLKHFWHIAGAVVLGAGIWCMHFTGMLAYHIDVKHRYDTWITVLSLALPIVFSYIVFYLIGNAAYSKRIIFGTAPFLALTVISMHYTGMAAMDMRASLHYKPDWFAVSVAIALFASIASLWLMFRFVEKHSDTHIPWQLISAVLMAVGICGLHYAGMKAAVFIPFADCEFSPDHAGRQILLALEVSLVALMIFTIAIIALRINEGAATSLRAQVYERTRELEDVNIELMHARDVAESASMAKTEFLAQMSHEIRTPLNAIIGLAEMLRSPTTPEIRKQEFVESLHNSASSLRHLLEEIMDYSKLEVNRVDLESIPFSPRQLVDEVWSLITIRAEEKGLQLVLDYDARADVMLLGDPLRIRQIFVNILSNAIKFTEKGHVTVFVRARNGSDDDDVKFVIEVHDTGIGISAEKIKVIFEKFMQAEPGTARQYGGSGLGLAIAKGLIDRMHGSIQVSSIPNKGSTFIIVLPLKRAVA